MLKSKKWAVHDLPLLLAGIICVALVVVIQNFHLPDTGRRVVAGCVLVGEKDDKVFISSEEAAIRAMEPDAENIWAPAGGEPVIVRVKEGAY